MLTSAVIRGLTTAQGRSITLPFRDSSKSSYFIKKIDGLEPVKAEISQASYPDLDEQYFQGARVGGRNIVITIGLKPDIAAGETVQALRRNLYKLMPPKTPMRITFNDSEMVQTYVDARVESVGPTLFDRGTDIVISFLSTSSYLTDTTVLKTNGFVTNTDQKIAYTGDAPTPFGLSIRLARPVSGFALRINGASVLHIDRDMNTGDEVSVQTTPRAKNVSFYRDGTGRTSLLDSITSGSLDLFFDAATDTVNFVTIPGSPVKTERFYLTYSAKYVGV